MWQPFTMWQRFMMRMSRLAQYFNVPLGFLAIFSWRGSSMVKTWPCEGSMSLPSFILMNTSRDFERSIASKVPASVSLTSVTTAATESEAPRPAPAVAEMDTMASGCRTLHNIGFVSPELICDSEVMFLLVPTPLFGLLLVRVMPHFELLLVRMMPWEDFEGPAMLGLRLGVKISHARHKFARVKFARVMPWEDFDDLRWSD